MRLIAEHVRKYGKKTREQIASVLQSKMERGSR